MQLDTATRITYEEKAPELLSAVDTGEAEWIMKRDPQTDYCVKFEEGLCGIHKTYGTDFLGDACHFFPRITRKLGPYSIMSAAMSCPEIARLALLEQNAFPLEDCETDRLPYSIKEYLPEKLSAENALTIHETFLACSHDPSLTAERIMARLHCLSFSLENLDPGTWPTALPFYWQHADGRLPLPDGRHEDPFNLLHALFGLLHAAKRTPRPLLERTLQEMQDALKVKLDPASGAITTASDSFDAWLAMERYWQEEVAAAMQPILKRWITVQLSMALFPFAGLGAIPSERTCIIGVRFATLKLALMAHAYQHRHVPPQQEIIRIAQSLSRFFDHLADPTLSLAIYRETGWMQLARMRALLSDA